MPLIITATDFSDVADHALYYACEAATAYKASVIVLHAYNIPVSFGDNPMPVMPIEESRQIAETHMAHLIEKLIQRFPGVSIEGHTSFGEITESLADYAKDNDPLLIVVGNSLSEDDGFWLGSNLLHILRESAYPVVAVPATMPFSPVKKICLACDYKNIADHLPASHLLNLVTATGASLHVLNVDHNDKQFGTDMPLESTALHQLIAAANPQYHYIDNADKEAGIQQFVAENNIDWLVITPHRHSFFRRVVS